MLNELKKEFFSVKLLVVLLILALSIYLFEFVLGFLRNFADIIWILVLGWLVSFILEPFADIFTKYLKVPKVISAILVFILTGVLITAIFMIFIPDLRNQFNSLQTILPDLLRNSPPQVQKGLDNFLNSISTSTEIIPSVMQFFMNLVTILILSFYLIIDRDNINKKIFTLTPKKYHKQLEFAQDLIDNSFASFVRIQALWGLIGGLITYVVLTFFGVNFAASTSILAGILTAVPVIGPIIGIIPPLMVSIAESPDQAIIIFLTIFIIQQLIFNVLGPKVIGKAFNINPIIVIFSLLIGIKVAGFLGAILAVPVISILLVAGQQLYSYYIKEKDITL
jgi:predicted PurR-regulated permease PerM